MTPDDPHGVSQGLIGKVRGGSFSKGFLSTFVSNGGQEFGLATTPLTAGLVGGASAELAGGEFGEGFASSFAVSAYNHHISSKIPDIGDLLFGDGTTYDNSQNYYAGGSLDEVYKRNGIPNDELRSTDPRQLQSVAGGVVLGASGLAVGCAGGIITSPCAPFATGVALVAGGIEAGLDLYNNGPSITQALVVVPPLIGRSTEAIALASRQSAPLARFLGISADFGATFGIATGTGIFSGDGNNGGN